MQSPAKTSIFNIANFLSLIRIFFAIPLIFLLIEHSSYYSEETAFGIFFIIITNPDAYN